MSTRKTYIKRISSEEEREGYFLVLRDKLSGFPPQGTMFNLVSGDIRKRVSIESYHCQCRGPKLPHEHYFIRWPGLRQGQRVAVTNSSGDKSKYRLAVE
jgi:hypothetical protein